MDDLGGTGIFGNTHISMVVSGSCKRWDRLHITGPPEGKDFKWYISGIYIYCQLGDYMPPTTF